MLGAVFHVVGKYVCDHTGANLYRRCAEELFDFFCSQGVQVITDAERAAAGLPLRDENGLTEEELQILENKMLEAMRAPLPFVASKP